MAESPPCMPAPSMADSACESANGELARGVVDAVDGSCPTSQASRPRRPSSSDVRASKPEQLSGAGRVG